jgi:hypothetical protein
MHTRSEPQSQLDSHGSPESFSCRAMQQRDEPTPGGVMVLTGAGMQSSPGSQLHIRLSHMTPGGPSTGLGGGRRSAGHGGRFRQPAESIEQPTQLGLPPVYPSSRHVGSSSVDSHSSPGSSRPFPHAQSNVQSFRQAGGGALLQVAPPKSSPSHSSEPRRMPSPQPTQSERSLVHSAVHVSSPESNPKEMQVSSPTSKPSHSSPASMNPFPQHSPQSRGQVAQLSSPQQNPSPQRRSGKAQGPGGSPSQPNPASDSDIRVRVMVMVSAWKQDAADIRLGECTGACQISTGPQRHQRRSMRVLDSSTAIEFP